MGSSQRSSQPSISRFFKSSPSKGGSQTPPKPTQPKPVEVIDLDDEDEVVVTSTRKEEPEIEKVKEVVVEKTVEHPVPAKNVEKFMYDRNSKPEEPTPERTALRQQYKRKLNQRTSTVEQKTAVGSDEEEDEPTPPTKRAKKSQSKLTPLDEQVKQLKLQHLDKVLAIQVGYKYKFYCEDAVKVHKILNIMLVPGKLNILNETPADQLYNKLAYCSIPEPRLHIHLQRLLDKGLKVGVVDQMETSTVKSVDNKSGLFKRQISNVFTKATYVEDDKGQGVRDDKKPDSLISILETPLSDTSVKFTIVSIQPLNGEIIYDEFEDDFTRNELETRLLHLEPIEILHFEDNLTPPTTKIIDNFIRLHSTHIRITTFPQIKRSYYETFMNEYVSTNDRLFDFVSSQTHEFQICCSLLIEYLTEFHQDASFKIVENYVSFTEANHMILNSNTLQNLEIFQNNTSFEEYGSLLWLLNHTRTKFGFRLLRKWISKPLVHREYIEKRLDAIENIHAGFNHFLESLAEVMKSCPDMEKMLSRIHYGKAKRKELYIFLNKLDDISRLVIKFGKFEILDRLQSPLLKEVLGDLIRQCLDLDVARFVGMINSQYAMDDRTEDYILKYFNLTKLTINQDEIVAENEAIDAIKEKLDQELQKCRDFLKRPSMEYTEKSREPYLIEVRNGILKIIPKDWIKISATKFVSRFRPPAVSDLYTELKYHNELYLNACEAVFKKFVAQIDSHYTVFNSIIKSLATYDCLLSLSATSAASTLTRPTFVDSKMVKVHNGRNPIIEQLSNYVPNDINMTQENRCTIITGPNMGGKSSYVKQVALIVIMAQIGCFVPAESATLGVFQSILTRMGAQDDLIKGESTFFTEMSQMLRVLETLKKTKGNSLVILDEIGRGTGTVDGISLASSIVEHFVQEDLSALVLFITHFPSICKLDKKYPIYIKNYHMGYIEEKKREEDWPKVTFLYNLVEGVASNSYGLNVAKLAFIDDGIIQEAYKVSKERQRQVEESEAVMRAMEVGQLIKCLTVGGDHDLKNVHKLVELCDEH